MKENKHISYFKVENFKRFESFEMENIGQFNLIVGDNNVGKTTVLEALLFDEVISEYVFHLTNSLQWRHIKISSIEYLFKSYLPQKPNGNKISYAYKGRNGENKNTLVYEVINKNSLSENEAIAIQAKLLTHSKQDELVKQNFNGAVVLDFVSMGKAQYSPFVPVNLGYQEDLCRFYSSFIQKSNSNKKIFIDDIIRFIPDIWDIEISNAVVTGENFIIARHMDFDKPMPITMLGEGIVKLLRILLEIYMCEGGRLMVDEIDTGIYHSRFKKFWKAILMAAKRNDVQLFMTTHSQECLKFIKEVLEEDEELKDFQKDMRCFRLVEHKDKSVKSYGYNYEKFQFAIDHENEIR